MTTEAEWKAKGIELFGEDMDGWRFVCPQCGNVESAKKVRLEHADALDRLRSGRYAIESECIGRHLPGVGCDWAAYGLFRGPVFVRRDSGADTPVFDFDGKPFTGPKAGVTTGAVRQ